MSKRPTLPVGDTVRIWRESRSMTCEELAASIGVSESMMRHIENGIRQPTLYVATQIADTLGTTVDDLVAGTLPAATTA